MTVSLTSINEHFISHNHDYYSMTMTPKCYF